MKRCNYNTFKVCLQKAFALLGLVAALLPVACTDQVQFGGAFLEKAPGGTVTADTVFSNAEYT